MIYIIKSNNRLIPCRDTPFGIILKPKNRNNRFVFRQASAELKELSLSELENLEAVKEKLAESEGQLLDYQTRLEAKYGDGLKLQLISVVAVGFERVVWKTVSRDLD